MGLAVSAREVAPGRMLVRLAGELDHATAGELSQALRAPLLGRAICLVVDLHEMSYINSAGLHVLLDAQQTLASRHGDLHVTGEGGQVKKALDLIGFRAPPAPPPN